MRYVVPLLALLLDGCARSDALAVLASESQRKISETESARVALWRRNSNRALQAEHDNDEERTSLSNLADTVSHSTESSTLFRSLSMKGMNLRSPLQSQNSMAKQVSELLARPPADVIGGLIAAGYSPSKLQTLIDAKKLSISPQTHAEFNTYFKKLIHKPLEEVFNARSRAYQSLTVPQKEAVDKVIRTVNKGVNSYDKLVDLGVSPVTFAGWLTKKLETDTMMGNKMEIEAKAGETLSMDRLDSDYKDYVMAYTEKFPSLGKEVN